MYDNSLSIIFHVHNTQVPSKKKKRKRTYCARQLFAMGQSRYIWGFKKNYITKLRLTPPQKKNILSSGSLF